MIKVMDLQACSKRMLREGADAHTCEGFLRAPCWRVCGMELSLAGLWQPGVT